MKQNTQKKENPQNPLFMDENLLTHAQLTDPDYRLKLLQAMYGSKFPVTCSKCHHCR